MVDKDNMSVEEMLAHCRKTDGEGGGSAPSPSVSEPAALEEPSSAPIAPAKPAAEMSMEEMLAAARGEKVGGAKDAPSSSASDAPAAKAAAGSGGASPKEARAMSMEEMLAAARGGKPGGGASESSESASDDEAAPAGGAVDPKAARAMSMEEMLAAARGGAGGATAKPKAAKPKAKPAAKAKAKSEAKPEPAGPRDTGSIFADRNPNKPGPVSKAEAAAVAKAKPDKPEKVMPVMPEKPAYAVPAESAPAEQGSDRRGFFAAITGTVLGSSMAIGFASLAVTNLLWGLGLAKFMFPNILIEPPTKFKVGFPGEYAPGQVQTKYKAQFGVWVVRYEYDGTAEIYALKSVCTHLGCTPNWLEGEQKFKCPCHGSGFYKDGINFEGPAPRPLERYAIRVSDDGQLEVDKSQTFNEEKGQWSDSACFVKA